MVYGAGEVQSGDLVTVTSKDAESTPVLGGMHHEYRLDEEAV
jgi:hypothetical protein